MGSAQRSIIYAKFNNILKICVDLRFIFPSSYLTFPKKFSIRVLMLNERRTVAMGKRNWRTLMGMAILFVAVTLTASCGPGLKEENEKLKKEVADLTAENEKVKADLSKKTTESSTLHSQIAELNLKISSLQTQNQTFQNEIDALKTQLKGKKKK